MRREELRIDTELLSEVIDGIEIRDAFDLWTPLQDQIKSLDDDDARRPGLVLMAELVFFMETFEERQTSYRARSVWDGKRSGEPDDLSDDDLDAITDALPDVPHPVIVARMADVLWIRRRQPEYAYQAIDAYLESAAATESLEHWTQSAKAIQRAVALAALFRKGKPEYLQRVLEHCEAIVSSIDGDDPRFLSQRLIDILCQHRHGDLEHLAELAARVATTAQERGEYDRARQYWRSVLGIARRRKDESSAQNALKAIVECFVEQGLAGDNVLLKVHFLEKAVTACGDVKSFSKRREEIHALLREVQTELPGTLSRFEFPDDIKKQRDEAVADTRIKTIERLQGLEPLDALITLCFRLFSPIDQKKLRAQTAELDRNSIAATIAAPTIVDSRGRTVARDDKTDDAHEAAVHNVVRNAMFERELMCNGAILTALELIETEHHISERYVFDEIASLSAFVPEENTAIVSKGLWFGLMRDFVGATTILVPQFEACIRHVLEGLGVRISAMGPDEVEKFRHLPTLLKTEETKQTFDSDVIDDLTLILVEPAGPNLRAAVAHGFITDAQCWTTEAIYAWWHMLRLVLLPIAAGKSR